MPHDVCILVDAAEKTCVQTPGLGRCLARHHDPNFPGTPHAPRDMLVLGGCSTGNSSLPEVTAGRASANSGPPRGGSG